MATDPKTSKSADRSDRRYDFVVFGATSFVGQLLCRYLVDTYGTDGELTWAIAGRNAAKLDEVAASTGADVDRLIADSTDASALGDLVAQTRAVVSTVGPYALYGSGLVAQAVSAGTDYCDLTGETHWMAKMIDEHQEEAEASGARIVHTCGFDSIPSDLGVWFTQQQAQERLDEPCNSVVMRVKALKGGASGGTVASVLNIVEEAATDSELRALLANPYALAPEGQRQGVKQPDVTAPTKDDATGEWAAPFVMAGVNTRVVHRSHALLGHPWGEGFTYDEAMSMGSGPLGLAKAAGLVGGIGVFLGAAALSPTRKLIERFVPKPGTGPTPQEQVAGFFDIRFSGTTPTGHNIRTKVTGDMDPGYGSTAKMLGESVVALTELSPEVSGGFLTPSTAFGDALIDRLIERAGLTFEVLSTS